MPVVTPHTPTPLPTNWQAFPKVSLHEHIDGSLRPHTLWELCQARGIPLPWSRAEDASLWMNSHALKGQLVSYLEGFKHTVAAMASPKACERVARELCEDAHSDGCVLAEFRFAPQLFGAWDLPPESALEAVLCGLAHSTLPCGLIVCGMRHLGADSTRAAAALAARYRAHGVVGFDLAGPELGFPPGDHAAALDLARDGGPPTWGPHASDMACGWWTTWHGLRKPARGDCTLRCAPVATCTRAQPALSPHTRSKRCWMRA